MKKALRLSTGAVITAAVAAVLFWPRDAEASIEPGGPDLPQGDAPPPSDASNSFNSFGDDVSFGGDMVDLSAYDDETKISAFLYMIRSCEHVYPRDVVNNADYQIFYGGSHFKDLSDHPVNTGEKQGVPLPAAMCRAAGYYNGVCVSTAAGAYQFTKPTWNRLRAMSPRLPDFSPDSQDEAARRLLNDIGATRYILSGDLGSAIQKASTKWASLPGSNAKQGGKPETFALARFNESLG